MINAKVLRIIRQEKETVNIDEVAETLVRTAREDLTDKGHHTWLTMQDNVLISLKLSSVQFSFLCWSWMKAFLCSLLSDWGCHFFRSCYFDHITPLFIKARCSSLTKCQEGFKISSAAFEDFQRYWSRPNIWPTIWKYVKNYYMLNSKSTQVQFLEPCPVLHTTDPRASLRQMSMSFPDITTPQSSLCQTSYF